MTGGQFSYLLRLAHIDSLSIPYMALYLSILAVALLPSVHFIGPLCDYTFASNLMW